MFPRSFWASISDGGELDQELHAGLDSLQYTVFSEQPATTELFEEARPKVLEGGWGPE